MADDAQAPALPSELPVVPLREAVVLPMTVAPLGVNRSGSIEAVNRALAGDRMVLLLLQHGTAEEPAPDDLHRVGTVAVIRQMAKGPSGIRVLVEGVARARHDVHVHVPAGAIPKDGPSAGVTMATAIVSAARGEPVRADVAMTGEITLSGLVLPVGGIREKALAARRYGIKTFVLPAMNEQDLSDLPAEVRNDMTFVPARTLEDVLKVALPGVPVADPTVA